MTEPPPTMAMPEACTKYLGISTALGYELVRKGEFPVPVLRLGRTIRIPRRPLEQALGIDTGAGS